MANYYCNVKTNYFKVTDVDKLKELVKNVNAELFEDKADKGYYGFGIQNSSSIDTFYDENDEEVDLVEEIQKILPDNEIFIMHEIGNEKLRYLCSYITIATNKTNETLSLPSIVEKRIKDNFKNVSKENLDF